MKLPSAIRCICLLLSFLALNASSSHAAPAFFVDAGGGYVQMKNASSFFNGSQSSSPSGYGLGLGLWTTFTNGSPPLEFQFGFQDRYESTNDGSGNTYGLNIPYAVMRLQASRLYLAFGYSPYVMRSVGGSSTTSAVMGHASGASAMLGEIGLLLPVTPKFSWGFAGTYEVVNDGGVSSPDPILSATVFMRFYFGFGSSNGSRSSNEFRGWRYPFGRDIH